MKGELWLWGLRYSTARGPHWKRERLVNADTAEGWLDAFRVDEPSVPFVVAGRKPRHIVRPVVASEL
jgi:hypothetical protein